MISPLLQLVVVSLAASIYGFLVGGGVINTWWPAELAAGFAPIVFVVLWAADDSRSTRYWPAFDYGFLLWVLMPFLIPHYVLHTRGRAGLPLVLLLGALVLAPWLASLLGVWCYDALPDLRG